MQGYMQGLVILSVIGLAILGGFRYARGGNLMKGREMVESAAKMISKGIAVIDVREEACQGYVKGAHRILVKEITSKSPEALKRISEITKNNKDAKIAIYCAVGGRAGRALKALQEEGYTNLQNLGGVGEYYDENLMEKCQS